MTGERLGPIGPGTQQEVKDAPQWQRDFLSKPSVSIRKGIAWSYNEPYENTDTLVLTAPSGRFIDIRLPKKHDLSEPLIDHDAFWAFTGTSNTTFPGTKDVPMQHVAHSVWEHDLDSKGPGITDEGDMFSLPNGDCAEVGMMGNPKTGQVEMYKEYWTSPPYQEGLHALKPCIVAEIIPHESQGHLAGIIIRIGYWIQGIAGDGTPGKKTVKTIAREIGHTEIKGFDVKPGEAVDGKFIELAHDDADYKGSADQRCGDITKPLNETKKTEELGAFDPTALPCRWLVDDSRRLGDELVIGKSPGVKWRVTEYVG